MWVYARPPAYNTHAQVIKEIDDRNVWLQKGRKIISSQRGTGRGGCNGDGEKKCLVFSVEERTTV